MRISSIRISNHSRLSDCTLEVREHLILVGSNGSGKSSLIRCLDLLLGKTTQQLYYNINDSDFRDVERPLLIEVKMTALTKDELSFFPDEVDVSDGSLTLLLEANLNGDDLEINRYCPQGATNTPLSSSQLQSIGWHLIPSNFSEELLPSRRKNIVDKYLEETDSSMNDEKMNSAIIALCEAIDDSPSLDKAKKSLATQLDSQLSGGVKAADLRFTPGSAIDKNPLSDVRLQIKSKFGIMREVTEQSDGTKALIALAIFDLLHSNGIIAIDEPENHLHPSAQRNLIHVLQNSSRQLIVATHSGTIAGEFNPDNIVVTRDRDTPVQPNRGFLQDDQKVLARWWISSKIELLTAKRIIAVEGQTDRMILEKVADLCEYHLERDGIELLEAGGCREMPYIRHIFGEEGFGVPVTLLIDEDAVHTVSDKLNIASKNFGLNDIYVSYRDLEDEYVSAIGAAKLWSNLQDSSLFTPGELNNCIPSDRADTPNEKELADFCRKKRYKTSCAVVACSSLDKNSSKNVDSVMKVLGNVLT